LHLALLSGRGGLAVVDAVEITAWTFVVVAEAAGAVNAHGRVDAIILASGAFGTSIARVGDTGTVGGKKVTATVHGPTTDERLVLVDLRRDVGDPVHVGGRLTIPTQHVTVAIFALGGTVTLEGISIEGSLAASKGSQLST
jgi:hypothetical protein